MTTDELLKKLPSHIGNCPILDENNNCCGYLESSSVKTKNGIDSAIEWLYLHNDGKDWLASYGREGEFLCVGKLPNGFYDNAFSYGSTPNEALQGLYDWCVKHGFIKKEK